MTLEVFIYGLGLVVAIGLAYVTGYSFGFADGMGRQINKRLRRMERKIDKCVGKETGNDNRRVSGDRKKFFDNETRTPVH